VAAESVSLQRLADLMATLRSPQGCPWDQAQTYETLCSYLLEEAYEVVDATQHAASRQPLREELGDLLLLIVFYAQIATEAGDFTLQDVIDGVVAKMVLRHPHVFGDAVADDSDAVRDQWARLKKAEGRTLFAGIPRAMPALDRAHRVGAEAATVGFDWSQPSHVFDKVEEEIEELREAMHQEPTDPDAIEEELGDALFAITNLARKLSLSSSRALRRSTDKFLERFAFIEKTLHAQGIALEDATLDEMERLWQRAKQTLRDTASEASS